MGGGSAGKQISDGIASFAFDGDRPVFAEAQGKVGQHPIYGRAAPV